MWFRYNKRILCILYCTIVLWGFFFPLGWGETAPLAPANMSLPVSPDLDLSTKVVRQYALTSANDFPQRDPENWRFSGKGLSLVFQPYAIACYACTPPPFTIPWADLKPILNPDFVIPGNS